MAKNYYSFQRQMDGNYVVCVYLVCTQMVAGSSKRKRLSEKIFSSVEKQVFYGFIIWIHCSLSHQSQSCKIKGIAQKKDGCTKLCCEFTWSVRSSLVVLACTCVHWVSILHICKYITRCSQYTITIMFNVHTTYLHVILSPIQLLAILWHVMCGWYCTVYSVHCVSSNGGVFLVAYPFYTDRIR